MSWIRQMMTITEQNLKFGQNVYFHMSKNDSCLGCLVGNGLLPGMKLKKFY